MFKTCVIGLGSMGMGAAVSLLRRGFEVHGVDVSESRRTEFAAAGGCSHVRPSAAAQDASVAFIFVVDDAQTQDVLFGENGAAPVLPKGAVAVCCATIPPEAAVALGKRLLDAGLLMIDAPVSGGAAKAAQGQMTIMASGAPEAFAKAESCLKAIATKIYRIGDRPGMGSRVKMINQLLAGIHIAAACEAMALGIKAGADPHVLYEVISNSAGSSWMFQNRVPHILDGNYAPKSAVDIFVKDLGIVRQAGETHAIGLPMTEAAHALFRAAHDMGLGREDDSAVVKVYAAKAGIDLPKPKSDI
jgi:L-threonate 2-dehydrogenase